MDLSRTTRNFRIADEIYSKVKIIAKKERRSSNNMMEYFIAKGIEKYEAENGEIILPEEHSID